MSFLQSSSARFSFTLLISICFGLFIPFIENIPSTVLAILISLIMFLSSFRVTTTELQNISLLSLFLFSLMRFVILPVLVFFLFDNFSPSYALGAFLLTLLPAGVTSPALSVIYSGNTSLALILVLLTSLLAPFLLPFLLSSLGSTYVEIDVFELAKTISLILILPFLLHLFVRKNKRASSWISNSSTSIITVSVGLVVMIAVAQQRSFIFEQKALFPAMIIIAVLLYLFYYLFGWFFIRKDDRANRITRSFASGYNNNMLGVVLAALYFDELTSYFAVVCIIAGAFVLVVWGKWLSTQL